MKNLLKILLFIGVLLCFAPAAHAQGTCPSGSPISGNHCYFISSATGNDSNNGTSESTPWANAPGMSTATGTAAAHSYAAGQVFVFKGCDTWNFATIGRWTPGASGSSGSLIHWGTFDQTWYNTSVCPSGWNRAIFSGNGTYPGATGNWFLDLDEDNYWHLAWIEFTGLYWYGDDNNSEGGYVTASVGDTGFEIDHNYFHGITFDLPVDCQTSSDPPYGACSEPWDLNQSGSTVTGEDDHNVFSGSDTTGTCATCYSTTDSFGLFITGSLGSTRVDHNYFTDSDNCIVGTFWIFDNNTLNHCGTFSAAANSVHNNVFEENADPSGGALVYNNLLINDGTYIPGGFFGNSCCASVSQLAPLTSQTSYFFNNLSLNNSLGSTGQQPFNCAFPSGGGGGLCTVFNNTIECGPDSGTQSPPSYQCASAGTAPLTFDAYYNHFITSNGTPIQCYESMCGTITQVPNPNLAQTLSIANGQSYTLSNYFAPQNGSGSTIQAGATPSALVSLCGAVGAVDTIGAGAETACENSTTCGVALVTSPYYTVGSEQCTPVARLVTGSTNNDSGAFQYNGGGSPVCTTSYSPGTLAFGNVTDGTTASLTETLSNPGSATCTGSIAVTTGTYFSITGGTCNTSSLSVAASGSCTVIVTFTPGAHVGSVSDSLVFTTNASSSPDTESLTGTGTTASSVFVIGIIL